jgi:hypothetical protein
VGRGLLAQGVYTKEGMRLSLSTCVCERALGERDDRPAHAAGARVAEPGTERTRNRASSTEQLHPDVEALTWMLQTSVSVFPFANV